MSDVSPKTNLEKLIRESYDLIHKYEAMIQVSSEPKEIKRAQRVFLII